VQRRDCRQPHDDGLVHFSQKVNVTAVLCPAWSDKDWYAPGPRVHNAIVTITYPDGTVLEAIVLAHEENEIRAIATGCNDALAFTRIHGTWISEEIEPVTIEFAWQRRGASPTPSLAACICPKTLAARLIQSLFRGCEPVVAEPETLCVFSPEGKRVPISISELPQEVGRGSRCH